MSDTDGLRWQRTSPLAAVYFLGKIYKAIAQNAVQSLAPLAAFLVAYQGDLASKATLAIGGFLIVTTSIAILRFWFFRFHIGKESILIRDGVIRKTQLDIKFDRIQAINTQQTLLFRLFGLTTVRLDTAGSSGQEGALPGIHLSLADSLKDTLGKRGISGQASEPADEARTSDDPSAPTARTLLTLRFGDVVKAGLASSRSLIFLAFLGPLIEPITENIEARIDESEVASAFIQVGDVGFAEGLAVIALLAFAVFLLLMLISVVGAFLRYHRFELQFDGERFFSQGGLLTRHEHAMQMRKIQSLHVKQNIVHRLFGKLSMHARQAASGRKNAAKNFIIPLVDPAQLPALAGAAFGNEFRDAGLAPRADSFQRVSWYYLRSRTLLTGLLPALVVVGIFALPFGWNALWFLLWVPVAAFFGWLRFRRLGYCLTTDGVAVRTGMIGTRVVAHLLRKVQRVNVSQSPFQRRKGLATLRLFLASGSVRIPFIAVTDAFRLRDYILYKVESSDLAWH